MITTDSPIVGYVPFDSDAVSGTGVQRPDDWLAYRNELYRLCRLVGFDFRILYAQAWHETAGFTSRWWRERLNPAGIGITGDPAQNAASHTWANGTDAARAHVAHMSAYVNGRGGKWMDLQPYLRLDPRYDAVFDAGYAGTVRTLGDLGNGKWATDPQYAQKIAAVANRIFKDPIADERPPGTIGCWWPHTGKAGS